MQEARGRIDVAKTKPGLVSNAAVQKVKPRSKKPSRNPKGEVGIGNAKRGEEAEGVGQVEEDGRGKVGAEKQEARREKHNVKRLANCKTQDARRKNQGARSKTQEARWQA